MRSALVLSVAFAILGIMGCTAPQRPASATAAAAAAPALPERDFTMSLDGVRASLKLPEGFSTRSLKALVADDSVWWFEKDGVQIEAHLSRVPPPENIAAWNPSSIEERILEQPGRVEGKIEPQILVYPKDGRLSSVVGLVLNRGDGDAWKLLRKMARTVAFAEPI